MNHPNKKKQNTTQGFIAYLLAAVLFSTSGIVARYMNDDYTAYGQVALRGVVIVLIMSIILVLTKTKITLKGLALLPLGIFFIAQPIGNITFAISANMIKATGAIFYLYVGQLTMGVILGSMILKEKLTIYSWIAFSLAGIGVIVYSFSNITSIFSNVGVLFGLICGVAEGVKNSALAKAQEEKKLDAKLVIFYQFLAATIGASIMIMYTKEAFTILLPTSKVITALTLSTIVGIGVTMALVYATKNFKTSTGNVIIATEVAFAALINAMVFREIPTTPEIIGGVILIFALIIVAIDPSKKKNQEHKNT